MILNFTVKARFRFALKTGIQLFVMFEKHSILLKLAALIPLGMR